MKNEFIALKGKVYNKAFRLEPEQEIVIGRGQDADIQILDAGLSRKHCAIRKEGDRFKLTDMDSRNGTYVNGNLVTSHELTSGDIIGIGGIEFEFRQGPDRRRTQADFIARIPDRPGEELKERVQLDQSELMASLPAQFQNIENYQRIQRDLAAVYRIGNAIAAETNLQKLYDRVLDGILEVINADRAFVIIANPHNNQLQTHAWRRREGDSTDEPESGFSTTIVNECFTEGTSILRADAASDDALREAESVLSENIHSVLCVPIESPERIIGVLYADNVAQSESFARHELELLTAVGKQAGIAIHRAQLAGQLRGLLSGSVSALVATIEAKDEYTRGHSERVTAYAMHVAKCIGLKPRRVATLELAGYLHDVGKIGVPESILLKPGPLTEEEYEIVRQHPHVGSSIVQNIAGAEEIAEIVRHHHERWDGRGYPDRLKEHEPSLAARILAVADAFDAMTSRRPYRPALKLEDVIEQLKQGSGKQFDPSVVEVFVEEVRRGRIMADDTRAITPETDTVNLRLKL